MDIASLDLFIRAKDIFFSYDQASSPSYSSYHQHQSSAHQSTPHHSTPLQSTPPHARLTASTSQHSHNSTSPSNAISQALQQHHHHAQADQQQQHQQHHHQQHQHQQHQHGKHGGKFDIKIVFL